MRARVYVCVCGIVRTRVRKTTGKNERKKREQESLHLCEGARARMRGCAIRKEREKKVLKRSRS